MQPMRRVFNSNTSNTLADSTSTAITPTSSTTNTTNTTNTINNFPFVPGKIWTRTGTPPEPEQQRKPFEQQREPEVEQWNEPVPFEEYNEEGLESFLTTQENTNNQTQIPQLPQLQPPQQPEQQQRQELKTLIENHLNEMDEKNNIEDSWFQLTRCILKVLMQLQYPVTPFYLTHFLPYPAEMLHRALLLMYDWGNIHWEPYLKAWALNDVQVYHDIIKQKMQTFLATYTPNFYFTVEELTKIFRAPPSIIYSGLVQLKQEAPDFIRVEDKGWIKV